MLKINKNFNNLSKNYLFVDIERKLREYTQENPQADIIKLGIGDVTRPLCTSVIKAMHEAVDEMSCSNTFHGYGPQEGYEFLRKAIAEHYKTYGVNINSDEIYVSDGAKSDSSCIQEIFSADGYALIPDPSYPVYVDSNIMFGRKVCYLNAKKDNDFLPMPDKTIKPSLIYICSPNNPTGAVYTKDQLKKWVDYALENRAIILFDAAYESFVEDENLPHSIFEVDGARECAIEICSFSKNAGFTGVRCAYMVIPSELKVDNVKVGDIWMRRQSAKFNGVSYITQKAALAVYSKEAQNEISECISYYKKNSKLISETLDELNIWNIGGKNSPYIWLKCPHKMSSWEFFDYLLKNAEIVGTPGSGFGPNGEGFFRISSFGSHEKTFEAAERLKLLKI